MTDLTPEQSEAPPAHVGTSWPAILEALTALGIAALNTQITNAGIAVAETGSFLLISEFGRPAHLTTYDGRPELGNHQSIRLPSSRTLGPNEIPPPTGSVGTQVGPFWAQYVPTGRETGQLEGNGAFP